MNKDQKEYLEHIQNKVNYPCGIETHEKEDNRYLRHSWYRISVLIFVIISLTVWQHIELNKRHEEVMKITKEK